MKLLMFTSAVTALTLYSSLVVAQEKKDIMVEQTTESPIAKMPSMEGDSMRADTGGAMKTETKITKNPPANSTQQTISDFIIHPLIAMKSRLPEAESGKQAGTSSTTSSPWQLFGLNGGLGPVSSLAGWLGNRIQLSGLVDTPVRESSSTGSTTTMKPDIVVELNQRASTKKPSISVERPLLKNKIPYRLNSNNFEESYDSDEYGDDDDDDDDKDFNRKRINRRRYQQDEEEYYDEDVNYDHDDEDSGEENDDGDDNNDDDEGYVVEEAEKEDETRLKQQNNNRIRHPKPINNNKKGHQKRRINNNQRKQQFKQDYSDEEDQYDDDFEDRVFYYNKNQESKRSKNEPNLIQRGQQNLLKQIKQFTLGQTPAEIGNSLRKSQKSINKKRRQQAPLLINRNGQTIYLAPELLQMTDTTTNEVNASLKKHLMSQFPQPPLTVPDRRKGQPTQYITIPWSKLGISTPNQIVSLTEGMQTQPLILNIPQSALDSMQDKKKQSITADAVPLLAEASIMDIFEPPQIPPVRSATATKPNKKSSAGSTPIAIATKNKLGPARIRSSTIVEKAPADISIDDKKNSAKAMEDDSKPTQFLVIGDEFGDSKLSRNAYRQILDYFNQHRLGRQLNDGGRIPIEYFQNHSISGIEKSPKTKPDVIDNLEMTTDSPMAVVNLNKDTEEEALV